MRSGRIRILELIYGFGLEDYGGGAERFALALAQALDPGQFDVIIGGLWSLGTSYEKTRIERLRAGGYTTLTLTQWNPRRPILSLWRALKGLRAYLQSQDIHILHSHSQFADIVTSLCKVDDRGLKIVRTLHDGHATEWRTKPIRRALLSNLLYPLVYDAEIGVSQPIERRLTQRWMARQLGRAAIHMPNAIDLARLQRVKTDPLDVRRMIGLPEGAFVVGTVGRLTVEKGYDVLLRAATVVMHQLPNTHFVFVGGGRLAQALEGLAQDLGIQAQVHFMGPRSDVEELLRCFDLFVSSSRWEGLSTSILESMASRVPVLATAVGGSVDLIQDGYNGWLVRPEDSTALAEAMVRAARHPVLRKEVATRALTTARRFSIENVVNQHAQLYSSLVRIP